MQRFRAMLGLCLLSLACGLQAQPAPSACEAKEPINKTGPFQVDCAGKLDCTATDTLQVKPAAKSTDAGPAAVCLRFANGGTLELKPPGSAKPSPSLATFALGNVLRDVLNGPAELAKTTDTALKHGTGALQAVTVLMLDDAGQASQRSVQLDMSALWVSALLKPQATAVACEDCRIRKSLSVTVPGLAAWSTATKTDPTKLVLVIDDVRIPGLAAIWHSTENTLTYKLSRLGDKPDNVTAWSTILENLDSDNAKLNIGLADDRSVITTAPDPVLFQPWSPKRGAAMAAAIALLVVITFVYGATTKWSLIRDDDYGIPAQAYIDAGVAPPGPRPFSLGRSQMLFWTVAVAVATIAIGLATGDWLNFNDTTLILLGLGVGTTLASVAADANQAITDQLTVYKQARAAAAANVAAEAQKLCSLAPEPSSGSWFNDVSYDKGQQRAGIHRLQSIIATLGFGGWFVYMAYHQAAMPVFTAAQLMLLGISNGAYVGFKLAAK